MKSGKKILALAAAVTMIGITAAPVSAASKITKEETVYVVTEADGSQSEVTVSDHLKNTDGADRIKDKTNLSDIENVKGEETFKEGKGDSIVWNAGGNDIFYQGTTDKDIPVKLGISYFLNGKEVQGSEMEGASGDVKIVIDYRNTATDETGTTIPFLAMTGFIVEDETLTDIEVDHGKVIDDGDKKVVVAIAAPGLTDAIDIDKDMVDLDLEDTVTITGKADKFDSQDMMTIVTNSIFEEIDSDDFGDLDYDDEINQLNKGSKALVSGSRQLYEGISTLYNKMPALEEGVGELQAGAKELSKGTDEAMKGSKKLNKGLGTLSSQLNSQLGSAADGVSQMQSGSEELLKALQQLQAGLAGDGTEENPGAVNALGQVESGLGDVSSGVSNANEQLKALENYANSVATYINEVDKVVSSHKAVLTAAGYGDLVAQTSKAKAAANGVASGLDKFTGDSGLSSAVSGIDAAKDGVTQVKDGLNNASSQMPTMVKGMENLNGGLTQMNDMFAKITDMSGQVSGGVGQLVKGSSDLAKGEVQLSGGAKQLAKGMDKLAESSGTLTGGVSKLDKGSLELSQGMNKLYQDGIRKIVDLYNDDLKGTMNDLEDVIDAGQSYTTFTELPDGADGDVKFIYKTSVY